MNIKILIGASVIFVLVLVYSINFLFKMNDKEFAIDKLSSECVSYLKKNKVSSYDIYYSLKAASFLNQFKVDNDTYLTLIAQCIKKSNK